MPKYLLLAIPVYYFREFLENKVTLPAFLFSILLSFLPILVTGEKSKKLRYVIGSRLDHLIDQFANWAVHREVNACELINYLCQGKIDPRISCKIIHRKHKYKGCRRKYCRFGDLETRTVDADKIYEHTNKNVNIKNIRGFKPVPIHIHILDATAIHENKEVYIPLEATLYSWSINGCRVQLKKPNRAMNIAKYHRAYIVFAPFLFSPFLHKILVNIKEYKDDETNLVLDYKINNPVFRNATNGLTAEKIKKNEYLKKNLYFCEGSL